jgi:aspartyl-tRNA(Asn)/glutamyl-tRNA(Gln) amidotransferase subunit A
MCDWAVGTDTGGSIRIPAALCGVTGFKPTLGTVSTERVIPLSRSLDTVGSLAPDVSTAASAVAGMAARPELAVREPARPEGLRLVSPRGWVTGLDSATAAAWDALSAGPLEEAGGLREVDFPDRGRLAAAGLTILLAEAAAFHRAWVERLPQRYGPDVLELLRQGLRVSPADYEDALAERERLRAEAAAAMEQVDALLLPASARTAPLLAETDVREPLTRFTRPFNTTGQPVFTLPLPTAGLPVGLQVVGREGDDAPLAAVALCLEGLLARTSPPSPSEVSAPQLSP